MSCLSHQVQAKAAFDHVLHSVLGKDNASALTRGLLKAGVDDICLLVNMEDSTISTLTYDRSEAEKDIPVPKGDKNLLQVFLDYVSHRNATIDPLSGDIGSWLHLSQASFDIFRLNPSYIAWRRVHGGKARSSSSKLSAVPGLATSKSCSQDDSKAQDCIPPPVTDALPSNVIAGNDPAAEQGLQFCGISSMCHGELPRTTEDVVCYGELKIGESTCKVLEDKLEDASGATELSGHEFCDEASDIFLDLKQQGNQSLHQDLQRRLLMLLQSKKASRLMGSGFLVIGKSEKVEAMKWTGVLHADQSVGCQVHFSKVPTAGCVDQETLHPCSVGWPPPSLCTI